MKTTAASQRKTQVQEAALAKVYVNEAGAAVDSLCSAVAGTNAAAADDAWAFGRGA